MDILITGAGGFIGGHLYYRLRKEYPDARIIATDIKQYASWYQQIPADVIKDCVDLRDSTQTNTLFSHTYDQTWMLACDHGGIGYLKTREYQCGLDVSINANVIQGHIRSGSDLLVYASSACVYNNKLQEDPDCIVYLKESDAYPASPDSVYGWVKLLTEKIVLSAIEERGLNARIGRIHGCYGPYNSFNNIKEKAPNALLRKALTATNELEVWNSTDTIRSFMYIDDCIEGFMLLINTNYNKPINIGSDLTVTIGEVANAALYVANRNIPIKVINGERGVACRSCDCTLMEDVLNFKPSIDIKTGLQLTKEWMEVEKLV